MAGNGKSQILARSIVAGGTILAGISIWISVANTSSQVSSPTDLQADSAPAASAPLISASPMPSPEESAAAAATTSTTSTTIPDVRTRGS